jgi:O-glycosyl hydrolase
MYALLLLGLFTPPFAETITIDTQAEFQQIDGFGTSVMNWDSAFNCDPDFYEAYAVDLGCSIIRGELHPAAITGDCMDKNPTTFNENVDENAALMNFSDYTRVSITGNWMQEVYSRRLDEMKVMLSIWTPPHWMKSEAILSSSQGCQSYQGYLTRTHENRTNFARYVTAWVKGFTQAYDVPLYGLSVQNELDWGHSVDSWTTSCVYASSIYPTSSRNGLPLGENDYNTAVRYVHDELAANDMHPVMMGPERSHIHTGVRALGYQMAYIDDMASDGTMDIMDVFIHHGYEYEPGNREMLRRYLQGYEGNDAIETHNGIAGYNKKTWQTEANTHETGWTGAMNLARTIHDQLIAMNLSGYLNWSFCAKSDRKWAFVLKPNKSSPLEKLDKYYAFKHFSRYIRPGAVRLGCTPDNPDGLSVSAYRHEQNGTLTIVAVNAGSASEVTIALPAQPQNIISFAGYTSQSGSVWQESTVPVTNNSISLTVPANGLVTLYGEGEPMVGTVRHSAGSKGVSRTVGRTQLQLERLHEGLVVHSHTANELRTLDLQGRTLQRVPR